MPVPIPCPNCGKKLRIPEAMLGRRVKCPACTKGFSAAHAAPAPPPPVADNPFGAMGDNSHFGFDADAEDGKTPIPGVRSSWKVVRFGLRCVSLSMFCYLTIFISNSILVALTAQEQLLTDLLKSAGPLLALGYVGCLGVLAVISVIAGLVGMALCIAAPSEGGMKVLAILALVGVLVAMVAMCGLIVPVLNLIIAPIILLVSYAANVLFVFFLRSCARSLQNPRLGGSFMALLIFQVLVVLVWIGTIVFMVVAWNYSSYAVEFDDPQQTLRMLKGIGIGGLIVIGAAAGTGFFSIVLYMLSVMRLGACIDRMMPRIAEA